MDARPSVLSDDSLTNLFGGNDGDGADDGRRRKTGAVRCFDADAVLN